MIEWCNHGCDWTNANHNLRKSIIRWISNVVGCLNSVVFLNTLTTRALRISDNERLDKEKSHLLNVFVENGYSRHLGQKAFLKASRNALVKKEPRERRLGVHLPYVQGTTYKIARILKRFDIPSTFRPLSTIRNSLRSVKDHVNPKDMKGVYVIPCSCGTPYIGETGCSIHQRIS